MTFPKHISHINIAYPCRIPMSQITESCHKSMSHIINQWVILNASLPFCRMTRCDSSSSWYVDESLCVIRMTYWVRDFCMTDWYLDESLSSCYTNNSLKNSIPKESHAQSRYFCRIMRCDILSSWRDEVWLTKFVKSRWPVEFVIFRWLIYKHYSKTRLIQKESSRFCGMMR